MYSFLICDLKNELDKKEVLKQINKYYKDADINFLCTDNKAKGSVKYKLYVFDKNVSEDVAINSVFKNIKYDKVFVIKSGFNDFSKLEKFVNFNEDFDILMLKNQKNTKKLRFFEKIKQIFNNFYYNLFNYYFYEGNISCILFNRNSTVVLKNLQNPATFIKIDKWIGMEIKYIDCEIEQYKPKTSFVDKWLNLICSSLVFVVSLIGNIFLYNKIHLVVNILLLFAVMLSFALSCFFAVRSYAVCKIGKINNNVSEYILIDKKENK